MDFIISYLDTISLLAILIAFMFLVHGWKRVLHPGVKFFFTLLLTLIMIYTICNIFEWTGVNDVFDTYADFIGILIPLVWGFLFYSFLQQLTEQELKNRDVKFRELFDEAPIGYHELDTKGRITRVNRTELGMLGYTSKEMLGHHVWDFIVEHETSHQAFMDKISGNAPPGHHLERTYRCKDGTLMPVLIEDRILKDEAGRITGIRSTIQDITERKQSIEEIKESEEFNRALFEYNPIETIAVNTKGEITNFNLAKKKSGDRLPQIGDVMYKDYADKHEIDMYDELMKCIKSGKPKTFPEQKYCGKFLSITISPFPKGAIIISQDITTRKFVEEALKTSEERYRELWDNAPIAYHTLDAKGIITSVNHTEAKMLGYKPEQMIGKPIFEFILPEQQIEAKKRFLLKIAGRHLPEAENRIYVARDGRKIPVSIDDILEYDDKGKVTGVWTTMLDITERKRAEEEREQNLKQVQKALGETINALVSAIETRDLYTAGHQRRVTQLASAIAKEMELPKNQVDAIYTAGLIHDIGKISVPAEILGKPAKLNNIEMDLIKTHPKVGYDILKSIEFPWPVADIVLQHHERMNGSGYPKGLSGKDILLEARILSVADVVEAMVSYRPYREALGVEKALKEISQNKGILYDPRVVDVCLKLFKEKKFKLEKQ